MFMVIRIQRFIINKLKNILVLHFTFFNFSKWFKEIFNILL
jgi:hypothetical protein